MTSDQAFRALFAVRYAVVHQYMTSGQFRHIQTAVYGARLSTVQASGLKCMFCTLEGQLFEGYIDSEGLCQPVNVYCALNVSIRSIFAAPG